MYKTLYELPLLMLAAVAVQAQIAPSISSSTAAAAGGSIPTQDLISNVTQNGLDQLQISLYIENAANALLYLGANNISTWGIENYPNDTLAVITAASAQQEVRVATIATVLTALKRTAVQPCQYNFLATNTTVFLPVLRALLLANIGALVAFTSNVASTDPGLIPFSFATVAAKSRLEGWVRSVGGLIPNPVPWETTFTSLDFAKHIVDMFVVPGTCSTPLPPNVPIKTFPGLIFAPDAYPALTPSALSAPNPSYSFNASLLPAQFSGKPLSIGWVNQLSAITYSDFNITSPGVGITSIPTGVKGDALAVLVANRSAVDVPGLVNNTLFGPFVAFIT